MSAAREAYFKVRRSKVHGMGAFATRRIRKGTRVCEYLGDRVTHAEADRRHESKSDDDSHTFLFIVDRHIVIDGGVEGNAARFINHGCDPNCESVTEKRRVYIEATRTIQKGEELKYDYSIGRADDDPPNVDEVYACRCGAVECRGTMLWPAKRPKKGKAKAKAKAKAKRNAAARRKSVLKRRSS
jgi:SET domain-containing protein